MDQQSWVYEVEHELAGIADERGKPCSFELLVNQQGMDDLNAGFRRDRRLENDDRPGYLNITNLTFRSGSGQVQLVDDDTRLNGKPYRLIVA